MSARMGGRGALIVFEGMDRSGKSTQTRLLVESLKGLSHNVELLRFPDRTTATGKIIDSYLKNSVDLDDRAIHLLFSANRWESANVINKKLNEGVTLVVDRYSFSGICFTAAKGCASMEWCKAPEAGLPAPDAVFFLKLPIQAAAQRGEFGQERYEKEAFQMSVAEKFSQVATSKWTNFDATKTIDALASEIKSKALCIISESSGKAIGRLWDDA